MKEAIHSEWISCVLFLYLHICAPEISMSESRSFSPALPGFWLQDAVIHMNWVRKIWPPLLLSFTHKVIYALSKPLKSCVFMWGWLFLLKHYRVLYLGWQSGTPSVWTQSREESDFWSTSPLELLPSLRSHAAAWHLIAWPAHPATTAKQTFSSILSRIIDVRTTIILWIIVVRVMSEWYFTLSALRTVKPSNFSCGVWGERRPRSPADAATCYQHVQNVKWDFFSCSLGIATVFKWLLKGSRQPAASRDRIQIGIKLHPAPHGWSRSAPDHP